MTGRWHLQAVVRVPNCVDNVAVLTYLKYQHSPPADSSQLGQVAP